MNGGLDATVASLITLSQWPASSISVLDRYESWVHRFHELDSKKKNHTKLTFVIRGGLARLVEGIFINNEDKMSRYE